MPNSASPQPKATLDRLAGKKVLLHGKFRYGEKDRLQRLAEIHGATVADALDSTVDFLVLPELSAGTALQKKAHSLNAKGASIETLDGDAFDKRVEPTDEEILQLLHAGGRAAADTLLKIVQSINYSQFSPSNPATPGSLRTFAEQDFDKGELANFHLHHYTFERCRFTGCTLDHTHFSHVLNCDLTGATGKGVTFQHVRGSRFNEVRLTESRFEGDLTGADFTSARIENSVIYANNHYVGYHRYKPTDMTGVNFTKATLRATNISQLSLKSPTFDYADLSLCNVADCTFDHASFKAAIAKNANLIGCKLSHADFTGADLAGANFATADLSHAIFAGANLEGCNFRGATLTGVDFSRARNYSPASAASVGTVGPSLTALDALDAKADRITLSLRVATAQAPEGEPLAFDSRYDGYFASLPSGFHNATLARGSLKSFSDAFLMLANLVGSSTLRYETLEVSSTKSPTSGKELRELVLNALAEGFGQPVPAEDELAAATKAWRDAQKERTAVDREAAKQAREAEQKAKEEKKKEAEQVIQKVVGKVTDTATFLKALELRIEQPKIKKATSMLKAAGFKLFNDITTEHLAGVVKSQTDPDLVYACRIDKDGKYACCTQNLNVCGGLRGSVCKHLLVLIIGLVQAGELDPTTIDTWVAASNSTKPELDKEIMGEIFIRYKGAEAGEVDWRPTETVPEDYYAL